MHSQIISISDLDKRVASGKSANSARYYSVMLRRLKAYNGDELIDIKAITPEYVSGFGDYLLDNGIAPSTIRQMLKFFRAVFKDVFGKEHIEEFKYVFKDVSSKNEEDTNLISFSDVKKIATGNIGTSQLLNKYRDIFMYCLFGGGIQFDTLTQPTSSTNDLQISHQRIISQRFKRIYGTKLKDFIKSLSVEEYTRGLSAIGHILKLRHPLQLKSAADGWIAAARKTGLSTDLIAASVASETAFAKYAVTKKAYSGREIINAREKVANHILDIKPRWYVMQCHDNTPTETADIIQKSAEFLEEEFFGTFIAPEPSAKNRHKDRIPLLPTLLFFHCRPENAIKIKGFIKTTAYIYQSAATKTPAAISDAEMRTFMLLCDVGAGTIDCHFPEYTTTKGPSIIGASAKITVGNLCGQVGVVSKTSKDKYKVFVEIKALGNAKVTAEIPVEFLQFD